MMKPWSYVYHDAFAQTPLSFWVHRAPQGSIWCDAPNYEPPLPRPVAGKGYEQLRMQVSSVELQFSSIAELEHFIAVLERKHMPTSTQLSRESILGPNKHWLSRLPAALKPWRKRERYLPKLHAALRDWRQRRK